MKSNRIPLRGRDIRKQNEKLILHMIFSRKGISQSEISQITGLKPPTVLRIFSNLENEQLIEVSKIQKTPPDKKGRKPVLYKVRANGRYAIGIDFWAKNASIVIVDFESKPLYQNVIHFKKILYADDITQRLIELIDDSIKTAKIPQKKILGIGIGAPGRIDINKGEIIYYARIKEMTNYDLTKKIKKQFNLPIYIHNNTSVIAIKKYEDNLTKNTNSLLTILIRSGVGGSFIQDGKILENQKKTILEIGHMCIEPDGGICECGSHGCLETYLSETAILSDLSQIHSIKSFEEIDDLLKEGSQEVTAYFQNKAKKLCIALHNFIQILFPEAVLIITKSYALSAFFCKEASKHFNTKSFLREKPIEFIPDVYKPIQGCIGATNLVFKHFFST